MNEAVEVEELSMVSFSNIEVFADVRAECQSEGGKAIRFVDFEKSFPSFLIAPRACESHFSMTQ